MQRLNAVDAITPAWHHTQQLLLAPRNWRVLLKIGAVAVLAQMGGCNLNLNAPGRLPHGDSPAFTAVATAMILFVGLLVLAVGLILFYIGSRMQFVLFQVVLLRETSIAPIWRRYGRVVWRWIGLKLLFFLFAMVCTAPILIPVVLHFVRSFPSEGARTLPAAFFASLFGFIAGIFLVLLVIGIGYMLLVDFGLPFIALEDASIDHSLRRVVRLVRQEPGQVALYVLMRFLVGLAFAIGAYLGLALSILILLIALGAVGFIVWGVLHHAGPAGYALMVAAWIVLGFALAAWIVVYLFMVLGYCFTFLQAYALYFLGGRYPLLGNLLEPGPGGPFTPPPIFPSPEEREEPDDDGPPMPMNPAVA